MKTQHDEIADASELKFEVLESPEGVEQDRQWTLESSAGLTNSCNSGGNSSHSSAAN